LLRGCSICVNQKQLRSRSICASASAWTTTLSATAIASFLACKVTQQGPSRNCGFTASKSLVGTCSPGQDVTLDCKADSSELAVRVCQGPDGCNHSSPLNLLEDTVCTAETPSTTFTCGEDSAFSAMVGPVVSGQNVTGGFAGATGGTFPARELQVFAIEEGSFYGNLFNPAELNSAISRTVDAAGVVSTFFPDTGGAELEVYRDAFACHDPNWTDGMAYLSHRLCAADLVADNGINTATLCAADKLGVCIGGPTPACSTGDAAPVVGDGDNGGCKDEVGVVRQRPLTVKLHLPCDLIPPGLEHVCERRETIQ